MGKPLPMELRRRVVDFVEEGHTYRGERRRAVGSNAMATSAQFRVSIKFGNDMVILKWTTGSLEAKRQGNGGLHGKLSGVADRTLPRIKENCCLTFDELVVGLRGVKGVKVHGVAVWRHLRGLSLTQKKTCAHPGEAA